MAAAKKATFGECKLKSCKVRFRKKRKDQLFCCSAHKDAYYRRGQFPFEKMKDEIMRAVEERLRPILVRVEAIETVLRVAAVQDRMLADSHVVRGAAEILRGGGAAA